MIPPRQAPTDKTLPTPDAALAQVIRSYGPGHFLIGERDWHGPVLVTPAATTTWNVTRAEDLSMASLGALGQAPTPTELLVLGCGPRAAFIAPALKAELKAAGLALEVVDTGSGIAPFRFVCRRTAAPGRRHRSLQIHRWDSE